MTEFNESRGPDAPPVSATEGAGPRVADAGKGVNEDSPDTLTASGRDELQRQLEEQKDKYLRLAAEYDNFRKRATKERQEAGWRAQADLVQGLVEVLDDIMRFAHVDPATTDADTIVQGVAMVEKKILKSLAGHGLEVLNPIEHSFDPSFHEAVSTEPAESEEDDHLVSRVYQLGFVFRGQLLRPARVVVRQWLGR